MYKHESFYTSTWRFQLHVKVRESLKSTVWCVKIYAKIIRIARPPLMTGYQLGATWYKNSSYPN